MTVLKHILPILGIATFIHAQDAVKQQEPQQVYISNELDYVPVSKSVMQLTLHEDDPADAPDPRDGDDTPKKKDVQTFGESGNQKSGSFKLGLHAGWGTLSIETYDEDEPHAGEYELGAIVALKNIVADMFVSTGFYCIGSYWRNQKESGYGGDVTHREYSIIAGVPITVGYQFMNMFNIDVGTQLSLPVFALGYHEDWEDSNAKWFPGGGSASITLGASAVFGQSHEIGFKVDIAKDYILYALTYNYWIF